MSKLDITNVRCGEFHDAVRRAIPFTAKNSPFRALECVLVTASEKDGAMIVRATDTRVSIDVPVEGCTIVGDGGAILPAADLARILKSLGVKNTLSVSLSDDGTVSLASGSRKYEMWSVTTTDNFPLPVRPDENGHTVSLGQDDVAAMRIAREYVATGERVQGGYTGVNLIPQEGTLHVRATNKSRMYEYDTGISVPFDFPYSVPVSAVEDATRYGKDGLEITFAERVVVMEVGGARIGARSLVDYRGQEIPDPREVMGGDVESTIDLKPEDVTRAIKGIRVVMDVDKIVVVDTDDGSVTVSNMTSTVGRGYDRIKATVDGRSRFAVNGNWLMQAAESMNSVMRVTTHGRKNPVIITGGIGTHLIMPVQSDG